MRTRLLTALLLAPLCAFGAAPEMPKDEFAKRRAAWHSAHPGSTLVLYGAVEVGEALYGFAQDPNFYYLSGWEEPGAALVLTPKPEGDTLLLPKRDPARERYTGAKLDATDTAAPSKTGFPRVAPLEDLAKLIEPNTELWGLNSQLAMFPRSAPLDRLRGAANELARMRMVKSAAELAAIEHSTRVSMDAHRAAWKAMKPGLYEYQVANTMSSLYFGQGCERHAYAPIVGSGPNANILHYMANRRRIDSGELVLMDVGAECNRYTTDITRTVPANGKFTARQRELYEIVLGAQQAAIAAAKPGIKLTGNEDSLNKIARDYIDAHGKDLHGEKLGKYFTHGLGHHVGLEVHDAADYSLPLAAGHVVTIEPGIYIPDENIGIRIEDMILITETGARVLSEGLPRKADEIERAMK